VLRRRVPSDSVQGRRTLLGSARTEHRRPRQGRRANTIEIIKDESPGIVAVRAVGTVSKAEYDEVVVPLLEEALRTGQRIRCLCEVGPEFHRLTPGALWEDVTLGLHGLGLFEACAVVSDLAWVRDASRLAAFLMPCPVQVFSQYDRDQALKWLSTLPGKPGVEHRLIPESGVVVVEASEPVRTTDVDALGLTVDAWLETHAELSGLVLHTTASLGWENIGGLLGYFGLVRDLHYKIGRMAVVVDGSVGTLAPRVAKHFVQAEVRGFTDEQFDDAVAWAAGPAQ
jgi:hypothetical protein